MRIVYWMSTVAVLFVVVPRESSCQTAANLPRESTFSLLDRQTPTPVPTPPPDLSLSLKAAIDVALENNPNLRQARSALEAADANFDLSRSPYRTLIDLGSVASTRLYKVHEIAGATVLNPTRSAQEGRPVYDYLGRHGSRTGDSEEIGVSQTLAKTFRNGTRLQLETDQTILQDSLRYYDDRPDQSHDLQGLARVSYAIPFNSRERLSIRTSLENAELSYQQALNNLYQQREQVMYQVQVSYWSLKLREANLQILRDDLAQRRWTYEYYQIQYEYGFAPEFSVKQSRVSMREREASILDQEAVLRSSYEDFNLLLGLPVEYRVELIDSLEVPTLGRAREEYVDLVLATNLRLKNVHLGLDRMDNDLAVTRLGQQPGVQLTSSYQRDDGGDSFANFQFQVSWPFGDGGATRARVRASESRIEEERIRLWDMERSLKQQVLQLLRDIETAQHQLEINEERAKLAAEALDTANFKFEHGQIDFRDLQAAQLDVANSRFTLAQTRFDLNVAIGELESLIHEY